jgi:hypothetical protein
MTVTVKNERAEGSKIGEERRKVVFFPWCDDSQRLDARSSFLYRSLTYTPSRYFPSLHCDKN